VVPFQNETGSPDLERIAKGVSDAMVVKLAESDGLKVIGNAAGLRFSFNRSVIEAVGKPLGAEYLILGQLKRDDRRMRVVAHLIRVRDQTHVWAHTYDTDALDLPQQAAIAAQIASAVSTRIGKG
jgi:TolB-like protein